MDKKYVIIVVFIALILSVVSLTLPIVSSQSVDNTFYWNGQDAVFEDNIDPDKKYALYTHDDGELETFQSELLSNSSGYLNINTSRYPSDKFKVISRNNNYNFTYEVVGQELDMKPNKTKAIDGSRIELEVISNRGEFNLTVDSGQADDDEIINSIELPSSRIDTVDENITLYNLTKEENFTINTSYLPSDSIEYRYNVTDTKATDNLTIMTTDEPRDQVEFNKSRYIDFAGNEFDMQFDVGPDVDKFDLQIGNEVYIHNVTIKETNNNGLANVTFNSFAAGNGSKPVEAGKDTEIVSQDPDPSISNQILAPKTYEMNVSVNGVVTDKSSLRLKEIVEGDISIGAITGEKINVREDDIDNVVQTNNISKEDYAVIEIQIGGLQKIINSSVDASDLSESSSFSDKYDFYLEIIEENSESPNSERQTLDLNKTHRMISNKSSNKMYVIVKGSKFPNTETDDSDDGSEIEKLNEYGVRFVIEERSDLIISDDDDEEDNIVTESEKNISIYESTVVPTGRYSDEENRYIFDKTKGDFNFETTLIPERNISLVIDGDVSDSFNENITQDLYINHSYNDTSNISIGDEFDLSVIPTSEEYEFIVGSNDVIDEINIPSDIRRGESVNMNITIKDDYDNLNIDWKINGNEKQGKNITHVFSETGDIDITVTVSDDSNVVYEEMEKTIQINNSVYEGSLGIEHNDVVFTNSNTTFNATTEYIGSLDYNWKIGNKTVGTNKSINYKFSQTGITNVTVTAMSEDDNSTQTKEIYVYDGYGQSERIYNYFSS